MNTTSPTFVTTQVGRIFLTHDEGEGDHNGSNYLMVDETGPNWIDGLDGVFNYFNRIGGNPYKIRTVPNKTRAISIHLNE